MKSPLGCTEYKDKAAAKNITKNISLSSLFIHAVPPNEDKNGAGSISYHVPHTGVLQSPAFLGNVSQQRPSR